MRETITLAVCLLLIFAGLQSGFLRTGLDYENLQKKMESLQTANDRLSEELKSGPGAGSGESQAQIAELKAEVEHYRSGDTGVLQKIQEQKGQWLKLFDRECKDGELELREEDNAVILISRDTVLFQGETEKINRKAQVWLLKLAQAIRDQKDWEIRIQGHTDLMVEGKNAGEKNARSRVLALNRAQLLGDFLDKQGGVDPVQIVAATCGANRPLVANDSEYHRAQNRRFEFSFVPVNPRSLNQARKIMRFEKQLTTISPSKAVATPTANETAGETQPLGADALDQQDNVNFKAGYEKPKE
ncbi:MAG: OmpA family protein [Candidatus Firestonebacteria bacterium]|nr:OmpA family protein [Candidatus Firestonebacteria bacterium]